MLLFCKKLHSVTLVVFVEDFIIYKINDLAVYLYTINSSLWLMAWRKAWNVVAPENSILRSHMVQDLYPKIIYRVCYIFGKECKVHISGAEQWLTVISCRRCSAIKSNISGLKDLWEVISQKDCSWTCSWSKNDRPKTNSLPIVRSLEEDPGTTPYTVELKHFIPKCQINYLNQWTALIKLKPKSYH